MCLQGSREIERSLDALIEKFCSNFEFLYLLFTLTSSLIENREKWTILTLFYVALWIIGLKRVNMLESYLVVLQAVSFKTPINE